MLRRKHRHKISYSSLVLVGRELYPIQEIAARCRSFNSTLNTSLSTARYYFPFSQLPPKYCHHAFLNSHNQQYLLIFTPPVKLCPPPICILVQAWLSWWWVCLCTNRPRTWKNISPDLGLRSGQTLWQTQIREVFFLEMMEGRKCWSICGWSRAWIPDHSKCCWSSAGVPTCVWGGNSWEMVELSAS
jgi:hypothetical protein